jgi:hypothetical protein
VVSSSDDPDARLRAEMVAHLTEHGALSNPQVAGDKAGNWDAWYRKVVPLADDRFAQHLAELEAEEHDRQ